jgi:hypothetical protein
VITMGMYDNVIIEDDIEELDVDHDGGTWQSKTIQQMPSLQSFKIENGRLWREQADTEIVPEEERPYADREDLDEKPLLKMVGMINRERTGWEDENYHGIIEIHTIVDDESVRYELKFTDGNLESIEELK